MKHFCASRKLLHICFKENYIVLIPNEILHIDTRNVANMLITGKKSNISRK